MLKKTKAPDLSFVYNETEKLYSHRYGRPPIDPAALVKYLLVGYLYGIPSERQIEQRIQTDAALRWYLGLDLFDRAPDHSTISQLRRRKPSFRKIFRRLFEKVVEQCIQAGFIFYGWENTLLLKLLNCFTVKTNGRSRYALWLLNTKRQRGYLLYPQIKISVYRNWSA